MEIMEGEIRNERLMGFPPKRGKVRPGLYPFPTIMSTRTVLALIFSFHMVLATMVNV